MGNDIRAFVAYTAARISGNWDETKVLNKDSGEQAQIDDKTYGYRLHQHPFRKGCHANKSCDGVNHCLVDGTCDQHICLSIYGKLFDGYNQATASHFSGMIYDDAVEIYDYSASDFFRFERT